MDIVGMTIHILKEFGLYKKFPQYIPKQYMWTYSYLTTPLSNLNYNIIKNNQNENIRKLMSEFLPSTISKRMLDSGNEEYEILLIRDYFNAVTGYCSSYIYYGYLGMYVLYVYMVILTITGILLANKIKSGRKKTAFYSIMVVVYSFMFFYNTLNYVGISVAFWIDFIMLFKKNRFGKVKNIKKL